VKDYSGNNFNSILGETEKVDSSDPTPVALANGMKFASG
jgi:hypothetical protein